MRWTPAVFAVLAVTLSRPAPADLAAIRAAASHGDAHQQLLLGELYQFGFGLRTHNVDALGWYLTAAKNGDHEAAARAHALERQMSAHDVHLARLAAEVNLKLGAAAPAPAPAAQAPSSPPPSEPASATPAPTHEGASDTSPPDAPPAVLFGGQDSGDGSGGAPESEAGSPTPTPAGTPATVAPSETKGAKMGSP